MKYSEIAKFYAKVVFTHHSAFIPYTGVFKIFVISGFNFKKYYKTTSSSLQTMHSGIFLKTTSFKLLKMGTLMSQHIFFTGKILTVFWWVSGFETPPIQVRLEEVLACCGLVHKLFSQFSCFHQLCEWTNSFCVDKNTNTVHTTNKHRERKSLQHFFLLNLQNNTNT